jgi:hypothetical protein
LKNILVIYFTQTGQAKQAIDAALKPFENNPEYKIHYERIREKEPFPYPWKYSVFFDAFPENVQGVPCELEPVKIDTSINYDLVFIVYQPWFLSICRPMNSFLLSSEAKTILRGKRVITIINCRNMWLNAQEKMKRHLLNLGADLVGNIALVDRSANLVSLVTVLAFELKGIKENYLGIFPRYGVSENDLAKVSDIGGDIRKCLDQDNFTSLQESIISKDLVSVRGNLLLMEGRGKALFPIYARFITKKGGPGSKARRTRVKIFGIVLPTAILILSPIITIISRLAPVLAAGKMKREISYYQHNSLRT